MHLLVPGAYRRVEDGLSWAYEIVSMHLLVPGAYRLEMGICPSFIALRSQCTFWCRVLTDGKLLMRRVLIPVSMHLLVPGAYRRDQSAVARSGRAVSMHLLVPGAYRHVAAELGRDLGAVGSQCTFWCRVLTDMLNDVVWFKAHDLGLNAPSGAGCLPTMQVGLPAYRSSCLNAPSGAGCLPTSSSKFATYNEAFVSMHLLVPGAYRHVQERTDR